MRRTSCILFWVLFVIVSLIFHIKDKYKHD